MTTNARASKVEFPDGLDKNDNPKKRKQFAVKVTTPVRLDQLDHEITASQGWRKGAGLSAEGDPGSPSGDEPTLLYVSRHEELPDDDFLRVVTEHTPDPDWTAPGTETGEPVYNPSFDDAKAKVLADGPVDDADIRAVLRGLLNPS